MERVRCIMSPLCSVSNCLARVSFAVGEESWGDWDRDSDSWNGAVVPIVRPFSVNGMFHLTCAAQSVCLCRFSGARDFAEPNSDAWVAKVAGIPAISVCSIRQSEGAAKAVSEVQKLRALLAAQREI